MRSPVVFPSNILVRIASLVVTIEIDNSIEYTIDDGKGNKVHVNVRRFPLPLYFSS